MEMYVNHPTLLALASIPMTPCSSDNVACRLQWRWLFTQTNHVLFSAPPPPPAHPQTGMFLIQRCCTVTSLETPSLSSVCIRASLTFHGFCAAKIMSLWLGSLLYF
jgi:hypothetical protein